MTKSEIQTAELSILSTPHTHTQRNTRLSQSIVICTHTQENTSHYSRPHCHLIAYTHTNAIPDEHELPPFEHFVSPEHTHTHTILVTNSQSRHKVSHPH